MTTYADKTTEELVLDLEAGALVLAKEKMEEFPRLMLAVARRLETREQALAKLSGVQEQWLLCEEENNRLRAELQAAEMVHSATRAELMAELQPWRELERPPCPTCGGDGTTAMLVGATRIKARCPDCSDGRVPWERLVKVFEAVHNDAEWTELRGGERGVVRRLRGI